MRRRTKAIFTAAVVVVLVVIFALYFSNVQQQDIEEIAVSETAPDPKGTDKVVSDTRPLTESEEIGTTDYTSVAGLLDITTLYPDILSPFAADIAAYLDRDRAIVEQLGRASMTDLVRQRYDLGTPQSRELAITDLYELLWMSETKPYDHHFPRSLAVPFLRAAVEEILVVEPDNDAARLLKAAVTAISGDRNAATAQFLEICKGLKGNPNSQYLWGELADTAQNILACEEISKEQARLVKQAIVDVGLSPTCPLASVLDGKLPAMTSTAAKRYHKDRRFDLHASRNYLRAALSNTDYGRAYLIGEQRVTVTSPIKHKLIDWEARLTCLTMEADSRGLVELARRLKEEGAPDAYIVSAQNMAHLLSGRLGVAIEGFKASLGSPFAASNPKSVAPLRLHLAEAYMEMGLWDDAHNELRAAQQQNPELQAQVDFYFGQLNKLSNGRATQSTPGG